MISSLEFPSKSFLLLLFFVFSLGATGFPKVRNWALSPRRKVKTQSKSHSVPPYTVTIYVWVNQVKGNIKGRLIREKKLPKGSLLSEQVWGWGTQTYLLCPSEGGERLWITGIIHTQAHMQTLTHMWASGAFHHKAMPNRIESLDVT